MAKQQLLLTVLESRKPKIEVQIDSMVIHRKCLMAERGKGTLGLIYKIINPNAEGSTFMT